jgi:hypothetical protein
MPYLGDFLGQLMSEIALARMQSDLETVRLAELYAAHPLLRTLPVPHLRLPNVDLDVPVLIQASEPPRAGESSRGGVPVRELRRRFDEVLDAELSRAEISLSVTQQRRVRSALAARMGSHEGPSEIAVDVQGVADDFTDTAVRTIAGLRRSEAQPVDVLAEHLREAVPREFLKVRPPPPRLLALVTSAEIRDGGGADNVTHLNIKLSEQGVEWTTIETDGVARDRLVPE